ncbi:putative DnaJ domain, Chaperone J-domain superfamily [Dioscorea sansibarensis]
MEPSNGRAEAKQNLDMARRLLAQRDLAGCKAFAEKAIDSDPLADSAADHILAIAGVLLAASSRRVNNHVDWYAVLDLPPRSSPADVRRSYRRLSLLLRQDPSSSSFSDIVSDAFRLVSDAWDTLSDPYKKSLFDSEILVSASYHQEQPAEAFWTACPSCCHIHQYDRAYIGLNLRCPSCQKAFQASELPSPPPVVPGTDMYYCSWGFFPLGFSGQPQDGWKPFYPVAPQVSSDIDGFMPAQAEEAKRDGAPPALPKNGKHFKKVVAKRKAGEVLEGTPARPVNIDINEDEFAEEGSQAKPVCLDINEKVQEDDVDDPNFNLDLDVSEELFGNLESFNVF